MRNFARGPACVLIVLACARAAGAGEAVVVEPAEWNYGVRPREHLIAKVVRLKPSEGGRVRIARMQTACNCLTARILREEGTAGSPAEVRVTMDTEDLVGRTRHMIFFVLAEPHNAVARLIVAGWALPDGAPGAAEVFYAADEASGKRVVEWWRRTAKPSAAGRVRLLPIEVPENYARLRELEKRARLEGPPADVIAFVGERVVMAGEEEVKAGLAGFLNLDSDGRPRPKPEPASAPEERTEAESGAGPATAEPNGPPAPLRGSAGPLEVSLYYYSDCHGCRQALQAARGVEGSLGDEVRLRIVDTARDPGAIAEVFALAAAYPGARRVLPSMVAFVGDELLAGTDAVAARLESLARRQIARGGGHLRLRRPEGTGPAGGRAGVLALAPVILTGLADGVNPCAFAAMVLLVSVLSATGAAREDARARRRALLAGGGAFCAGVFATYYLAGMGLFVSARRLEGFPAAEAVVFWAVWGLAILGGALSAADAAVYFRTRDPERLRLKVPEALRRRMAPLMRSRFGAHGLVLGGLAAGALIAILEGVCTGQMYLPIIQYMARTPGLRSNGAAWLALYNLLFVLPLLAILGFALAGAHFQRLNAFLKRNLGVARTALAVVFFVLAAAMLAGRWGLFGRAGLEVGRPDEWLLRRPASCTAGTLALAPAAPSGAKGLRAPAHPT